MWCVSLGRMWMPTLIAVRQHRWFDLSSWWRSTDKYTGSLPTEPGIVSVAEGGEIFLPRQHPVGDGNGRGGKRTVYEAIQYGLRSKRYFHFNLCTTTRIENAGEYHRYITCIPNPTQNPIFSPINQLHQALNVTNLLYSTDLKYTTIYSYAGNAANGKDTLILALESELQGRFHNKAPVGTLGYRWDKAGRSNHHWNDVEYKPCALMLVWSESKL